MRLTRLLVFAFAVLHETEAGTHEGFIANEEPALSLIRKRASVCEGKADVVVLLDESGSIKPWNFQSSKTFVENLVRKFSIGPNHIQFSLVTFGSDPRNLFNLNQYSTSTQIIRAIKATTYDTGTTNTADALDFMVKNSFSVYAGARDGVPKIGIVITDGDSDKPTTTRIKAKLAKDADITILAIGVGSKVKYTELQAIASDPASKYVFQPSSFEKLKQIVDLIANRACEDVKSTFVCERTADFVFLVDESSSVNIDNFQRTKIFVKGLVSKFSVGPNKVRFGLVTFGSNPRKQFDLKQYSTSDQIIRAIDAVGYDKGSTNTADALAFMVRHSFSVSAGARNGVPKGAIVITDGQSMDTSATRDQAKLAKGMGITILSIGVGTGVNYNELRDIASDPKSKYVFEPNSFKALKRMEELVARRACEGVSNPRPKPKDLCQNSVNQCTFWGNYIRSHNGIWWYNKCNCKKRDTCANFMPYCKMHAKYISWGYTSVQGRYDRCGCAMQDASITPPPMSSWPNGVCKNSTVMCPFWSYYQEHPHYLQTRYDQCNCRQYDKGA